jgi:hypothetical protein
MRRLLLPLAIAAALVGGALPAHAGEPVQTFSFGLNDGKTAGFTSGAWRTDDGLTDPENHHIDTYCNFTINGVGNSVVITLVAQATATAHLTAVSTGIYCELRDGSNNVVFSIAHALPGVHVTWAGTSGLVTNNGPYTVCSRGTGQWDDTHLLTTPLSCQVPNLPI